MRPPPLPQPRERLVTSPDALASVGLRHSDIGRGCACRRLPSGTAVLRLRSRRPPFRLGDTDSRMNRRSSELATERMDWSATTANHDGNHDRCHAEHAPENERDLLAGSEAVPPSFACGGCVIFDGESRCGHERNRTSGSDDSASDALGPGDLARGTGGRIESCPLRALALPVVEGGGVRSTARTTPPPTGMGGARVPFAAWLASMASA